MTNNPDPIGPDRARHAALRAIDADKLMLEPPGAKTLRALEAAVASMPRMRRQIFLAVRLDDLPYRQIADQTGLSVAQVERQMAGAMRQLVRAMSERPAPRSWWRCWLDRRRSRPLGSCGCCEVGGPVRRA
jgi:DNA-directed RNA polymerase specialized sigma24 family protein